MGSEGKVVAVTGAGQGIGRALVAEFLRRGYEVLALLEKQEHVAGVEHAASGLPGKLHHAIVDVTRPGDFRFPDSLYILINNAGIRLRNIPVEVIEMEEWHRYFAVNFFGTVDMSRRAIAPMRARGGGVICNINSTAIAAPLPFLAPYRATKGAMAAFSETLRAELFQFGIRVMEIMPGSVDSNLRPTSLSTQKAEASDIPEYAALADSVHAMFTAANPPFVSTADAAEVIASAIEEEDGRFRYGTDPGADQMIENWRSGGGDPAMIDWIRSISPAP